jgi:AbrB family looped-hinge helix DNA binding protein
VPTISKGVDGPRRVLLDRPWYRLQPPRLLPPPLPSEVILTGMTHRVGRKGQVVIPKAFRKAIRLEPGDEVTFSQEGTAIRLERVVSPDALMGRWAGHRLVEALEKDRQGERRR